MKFRCPYCNKVLDRLEHGLCPFCSKAVRMPDKPRREDYEPRARRAPSLRMRGGPMGFLTLFSGRPGFLVWVFGIGVIVVVGMSVLKVDLSAPRRILTMEERTDEELRRLHTALQWYRQTHTNFPTTEEGLDALQQNHAPGWQSSYVVHVPDDLWGTPFQYSCSNDTVCLFSCGPDKLAGTADDVASPGPDYKGLMNRLVISTAGTN